MKYKVIVGGNPYTVVAEHLEELNQTVLFYDQTENGMEKVAEFNRSKVDGIIWEDNNASE